VTLTQTVMVNKSIESEENLPCQDPFVIFTDAANKDYFVENEQSGNFVLRRKFIGKLKISRTNKHLVAKEIEQNLVTGDTKLCNQSASAFTTITSLTSTTSSSPCPHSLLFTNTTSMSVKGKERAYLKLSKDIIHDEQESNK
ncbi:5241_t:CDS:2, partial [Funneliformis mosseae]